MAIAIIIEDGTIVAGANSYATIAEARAYATARGVILPLPEDENDPEQVEAADDQVAVMLIKAMDYLRTLGYVGDVVEEGQPTPFPRKGMYVYRSNPSAEFPTDEVPKEIKEAQMQLVLEVANGVQLLPTNGAAVAVKREKIGPIETEFSEGSLWLAPVFPMVDALLARFLFSAGVRLQTYRA